MSPVSLAREGAVALITVDNPPVNALSQAVREGLVRCLEEAHLKAKWSWAGRCAANGHR